LRFSYVRGGQLTSPAVADAPYPTAPLEDVREERLLLGYVLVWAAVAGWSLNAVVSKVILGSTGLSALRLTEVRATGTALVLLAAVAVFRPRSLRITRRELPFLIVFGVAGLACVQLFYFLAIERLEIGIALVIQYLAPVFVALWARFVVGEPVRRRLWLAIALSLAGLSLVVQLWRGLTLDAAGVAACLAAAVAYAGYVLMAERGLREGRDAISLLAWGFVFSALVWALIQPWWSFPFGSIDGEASLLGRLQETSAPIWLLLAYVVIFGTVVPFFLLVTALHHVRATRATVIAMLEPVLAAAVAYAWLGEELAAVQIAGAVLVLVGVGIAQTARPTAART
jgi:drug/metabolite transporter (DMT)-like permease